MNDTPGKRAWMCLLCGWVYYETLGLPDEGIPPGTPWENIPDDWECPTCGATKEDFIMEQL
ncbi:rubredoxin [Streptomyces griseofuscus]|nr:MULTISPECIES: rubredoxin [unclassified Streptomyces]MYQ96081.1 rubredoxin [Streptomyces sp. SID4946]SCF58831.1 Rubredoxin [Streptomyces sp. LamerLS-31b]SCF99126.1 Rubredoxin [Streptomyces sp. DconLS]